MHMLKHRYQNRQTCQNYRNEEKIIQSNKFNISHIHITYIHYTQQHRNNKHFDHFENKTWFNRKQLGQTKAN